MTTQWPKSAIHPDQNGLSDRGESGQDLLVPDFLSGLRRWMLWRAETPNGTDVRPSKIPYNTDGFRADVKDPENWATYDQVRAVLERPSVMWNGPAISLGDLGDGETLCGIDLDSCLHDGTLAEWASPLLRLLASYHEVSPSGAGVKSFFRANSDAVATVLPHFGIASDKRGTKRSIGPNGSKHGAAVEIYFGARFFTVTGHPLPGSPEAVALVGREVLEAVAALLPSKANNSSPSGTLVQPDEQVVDPVKLRLKVEKALLRDPRLRERWGGSRAGLKDTTRSAFDLSLGAMLKNHGFSLAEMRSALIANPHGAGSEKAADHRYFERIWSKAPEISEVEAMVLDLNDRYMVVNESGRALVYSEKYDQQRRRLRYDRTSFPDFHRLLMNRTVVVGSEMREVRKPLADVWLRHPNRREYIDGIVFDPSNNSAGSDRVLNLWRGFAVEPKQGNWDRMREHIRQVICRYRRRL